MEQIKVTAYLLDGRMATSDGLIHLDAILYSAYAKKYHPELVGIPFDFKNAINFPLPVKKINENTDNWYYDCSFALFEIMKQDTRMYNKRFDESLIAKHLDKPKVIETRKGKFKNCRIALNVILTKEITWYLTADKEEVKELLKQINFVGKKHSQGLGFVKEWKVESTEESLSHLRAIPDKKGNEIIAIRPIYFDKANERRVSIPDDVRIGYIQMFESL